MPDGFSNEVKTKTVSNPDLKALHDRTSPTLTSLMLLETMKWGSILVVLFVIFSFTEPLWGPVLDYLAGPTEEATDPTP
ncbi:MAG: hypothetical protein IT290_05945 [Deltaproteobacteria bacterium]|nr:hypothetical protein [Deltaproteobacteria bacterium]